jgi:two-component system, sensor histidine kinase LadS
MNPLYYVENQEFKEIKADKIPIGGQAEKNFAYQKHEIIASSPTTFYLCSDGYQDQFGGENNKKFMVKNLKKLLLDSSEKPLQEQKEVLATNFDTWKGSGEQTDDVLVVAVKI